MRKNMVAISALAAALQAAGAAQVSTQAAVQPGGPKLSFEVVSVKPSAPVAPGTPGATWSNIPLTPGDRYAPNDGYFSARGLTAEQLAAFAYSMDTNPDPELHALPEWAKSRRWDIEARAGHPASKNQMRAMILSLLQDRFRLVAHFETRNVPVYALVVSKPGHLGPQMRPHVDEGLPCDNSVGRGNQLATPDGYPMTCGDLAMLPGAPPGHSRLGGRNVTMPAFMAALRAGLDRIAIDRTGLTGRYDWWIEYVPDPATDGQYGTDFPSPDPTGPRLWTAFKEQLGLELKATRADVPWLVFDHIEEPTAN